MTWCKRETEAPSQLPDSQEDTLHPGTISSLSSATAWSGEQRCFCGVRSTSAHTHCDVENIQNRDTPCINIILHGLRSARCDNNRLLQVCWAASLEQKGVHYPAQGQYFSSANELAGAQNTVNTEPFRQLRINPQPYAFKQGFTITKWRARSCICDLSWVQKLLFLSW